LTAARALGQFAGARSGAATPAADVRSARAAGDGARLEASVSLEQERNDALEHRDGRRSRISLTNAMVAIGVSHVLIVAPLTAAGCGRSSARNTRSG
jgi:hypothetical protein